MVKVILIPTDFSVASLNTLKLTLEKGSEIPVEILLMYSELSSDSITDLLFYSRDKIIASHITPEFIEALEVIKNRFEHQVKDIGIKVFHGNNKDSLQLFMEVNGVDEVCIPKSFRLSNKGLRFDPIPMLRKIDIPLVEVDWTEHHLIDEKDQLNALFT